MIHVWTVEVCLWSPGFTANHSC